jgi:pyrroline-5-carboxylate reductase
VEAGVAKGLSEQQARSLVTQSGIGAGILAQSLPHSFSKLLSDVCVSGGSTEKAMATLESHRASHAILEAVDVSWRANVEMGDC